MKKIFTYVLLLVSTSMFAQMQPESLSVYDADGNCTDRYQYRYDADGNQIEEIDFSGDDAVGNMRRSYTYDAGGKMTKAVTLKMENGKWAVYRMNSLTYNADGALAGECNYQFVDGQWKPSFKTEISYSGASQTVSSYNWDGNEWVKTATDVIDKATDMADCTYDDRGNITSRTTYVMDAEGERVNNYRQEFAYDTNGRNTVTESFIWADGQWMLDTTERYSYAEETTGMNVIATASAQPSAKKVFVNGQVNIIAESASYLLNGMEK